MAKTKGAVQFGSVSLEELNRVLKPAALVLVSIKYAKQVGLNITPCVLDNSRVTATAATGEEVADVVDFGAPSKKTQKKKKVEEVEEVEEEETEIEVGVMQF